MNLTVVFRNCFTDAPITPLFRVAENESINSVKIFNLIPWTPVHPHSITWTGRKFIRVRFHIRILPTVSLYWFCTQLPPIFIFIDILKDIDIVKDIFTRGFIRTNSSEFCFYCIERDCTYFLGTLSSCVAAHSRRHTDVLSYHSTCSHIRNLITYETTLLHCVSSLDIVASDIRSRESLNPAPGPTRSLLLSGYTVNL